MASITPSAVAEIFKNSVEFDMVIRDTSEIVSSSQLSFHSGSFETLLDTDSFNKLLGSIVGLDRNTREIFEELHEAELGIQIFADRRIRKTPRRVVAQFLNCPEYSYHESDLYELYFAVNTWLVFFGESEIPAEWESCPMCGSVVKDYFCTSSDCRSGSYMNLDALLTLEKLFVVEADGNRCDDPDFWDKIKPGSEFYAVYKQPIEEFRMGASPRMESMASDEGDPVFDLGAAVTALDDAGDETNGSFADDIFDFAGVDVDGITFDYGELSFDGSEEEPFDPAFAKAKETADREEIRDNYARKTGELFDCIGEINGGLSRLDVSDPESARLCLPEETLIKAESLCRDIIAMQKSDPMFACDGGAAFAESYVNETGPAVRDLAYTVLNLEEILEEKHAIYIAETDNARIAAEKCFADYSDRLYDSAVNGDALPPSELDEMRDLLISAIAENCIKKKRQSDMRLEFETELCRRRSELLGKTARQ